MAYDTAHGANHWLNRDRLKVYPRLFLTLYFLALLGLLVTSHNGIDAWNRPLGTDFIAFWGASHTWLHGNAADAYDVGKLALAQRVAIPESTSLYGWFYPPTFYLLILPLALVPYGVAFVLFTGGTLYGFLVLLKRIVKCPEVLPLALAFPGVFFNLLHGQNGFLTATLTAAALMFVERRPIFAGALIGLLAIKPHLAVLFPIALIAARHYRATLVAAGSTGLFIVASIAVVSPEAAEAFLHNLGLAQGALEQGGLSPDKIPTIFALMRLLGFELSVAYFAHIVVALFVIMTVAIIWRQCPSPRLKAASLMTGTLLISPYLFFYDFVWLAFPIAWITAHALKQGWLRLEREVLTAVWLAPIVAPAIAHTTQLQVGPLITAALLVVIAHRAFIEGKKQEKAVV